MKKVFKIILTLFLAFVVFFVGFLKGFNRATYVYKNGLVPLEMEIGVTGEAVFEEINEYRISQGVHELELDFALCNNIQGRWDKIYVKKTHEGLDSFAQQQYTKGLWPRNLTCIELFASGPTAKEIVRYWSLSPGHKLYLLDKEITKVCTYANSNMAVIFLGEYK